jgi:two-component system sensor histidine kinase KdpD
MSTLNITSINTASSSKLSLSIARFALSLAILCILTWAGWCLHVNLTTISFIFLLLVLCTAYKFGFWGASAISILAVAVLDYFFTPPIFHFEMDNPQDWVALVIFEITALMLSRISAHELRSAQEANLHRQGMIQLYELSRNSIQIDMHQAPGPQLLVLIQRIFQVSAVAIYDAHFGRQDRLGDWNEEDFDLSYECYLTGVPAKNSHKHLSSLPLVAGNRSVGALVLHGNVTPFVADAVASLAAIAIHRYQLFENEERAENESRAEQLRAAVLDSLAHELKTPLTAVQMASSGLLELCQLDPHQHELATLIDKEIARLNQICTRLLRTARLDSTQVGVQKEEIRIKQVVDAVLQDGSCALEKKRVSVDIVPPALTVRADSGLLSMILMQYLDNARKYAYPNTPVSIQVRKSDTEVLLSVHNHGPTIHIEDRERIFDRFYRCEHVAGGIEGTGIGLSVVRKAAEAHHGHVWVVSEKKAGTTFYLSLPQSDSRKAYQHERK